MHQQVSVFLAVVLSFLASTCTLNTALLASSKSGNSSQNEVAKGQSLQKQNVSGAALTDSLVNLSANNATAPHTGNKAISTDTGTPVQITLTGTDPIPSDVLKFSVVANPPNGTLTNATSNSVTYTPNTGFLGADSFIYKGTDGQGVSSNNATVTITVTPGLLKPLQSVLAVLLAAPVDVSGSNMYVVWPNNDTGHWNVFFAKSTDGGKSIQNTIILSAPNKGHTIDQNTGITASGTSVFVTWWTNKTGVLKPVLRTSSDSGVTFGKTITLNSTIAFAKTSK
jgi:hypothetical protein